MSKGDKITENIDLEEIERKTWRSTLEDGFLDIYLGILVLGIGIGMGFDYILPDPLDMIVPFIFFIIGITLFLLAKKYVTQPRLGIVRFGFKQKTRKIKTVLVLIFNLIFLSLFNLLLVTNPELESLIPNSIEGLIIGLLCLTIPLCFIAYIMQYRHLYYIAILFGLVFFLSDIFSLFLQEPFDVLIVFFSISLSIILMGLVSLKKFLKKYPLSKNQGE